MRNIFTKNSRRNLIYMMLFIWIVFGACGFYHGVNFLDLSGYFAAFAGPAMTYIWAETRRPHGNNDSSS